MYFGGYVFRFKVKPSILLMTLPQDLFTQAQLSVIKTRLHIRTLPHIHQHTVSLPVFKHASADKPNLNIGSTNKTRHFTQLIFDRDPGILTEFTKYMFPDTVIV